MKKLGRPGFIERQKEKLSSYLLAILAITGPIGVSALSVVGVEEANQGEVGSTYKGNIPTSRIEEIAEEAEEAEEEKVKEEWEHLFDTKAKVNEILILGDLTHEYALELAHSEGGDFYVTVFGNMGNEAADPLCDFDRSNGRKMQIEVLGKIGENVIEKLDNCPSPSTRASSQPSSQSTP